MTINKNTQGKIFFRFLLLLLFTIGVNAEFTKSGNIVTDSTTGLQWQDDAIGSTVVWTTAIDLCETLNLDGYSDWRLPNINEIKTIIDDTKVEPTISDTFQYAGFIYYYWSSTTYAGDLNHAWHVNFRYGNASREDKRNSHYFRCVREE